jgi:hypothetical protein
MASCADWMRSYPGGDALAYQKKGFLFREAVAASLAAGSRPGRWGRLPGEHGRPVRRVGSEAKRQRRDRVWLLREDKRIR